MRAISVLSLETGTSTRWCLAAAALRRRVRKSAMGSVCISPILAPLTAAAPTNSLSRRRGFPLGAPCRENRCGTSETCEYSRARAAAAAAVAHANLELRLLAHLGDFCGSCHGL